MGDRRYQFDSVLLTSMFEKIAASCCEGLSHLAKLEKEEGRRWPDLGPTIPASTLAPVRRSGRTSALPYPPPRSSSVVIVRGPSSNHPFRLACLLAASANFFKLAIPLGEDHLFQAGQLVSRRHIADRAVEPHLVVMADVLGNASPRIVE